MDVKLVKIVEDIQNKTGLVINVYNILGEILTEPIGYRTNYRYTSYGLNDFIQGIKVDHVENITYFLINTMASTFIGVIAGSDDVSRNYAYMVSSLIENSMTRSDDNMSRSDTLKRLLVAECTRSQIENFMSKYLIPSDPVYIFVCSCDRDRVGEVFNFLSQYSENESDTPVLMDDNLISYLSFSPNDSEYQSALDFAQCLDQSLVNELGMRVQIGVGGVAKTLFDVPSCYQQAVSALRMGIQSASKSNVHSYKEYIMIKMIEDIPRNILQQYLQILLDASAKDILDDNEMVNTAEEFLNNSLNISETSRHLYMHRNTLMYRLDKIERSMGLNIRRFSDAVTFRIIMVLYKHLKTTK